MSVSSHLHGHYCPSPRAAMQRSMSPSGRARQTVPRAGVGPPHRTRGFSLVEVLVAVLVVTIGLLSLAALQVAGVKATESAQLRTLATIATYDTVERLRADPKSLISNSTRTSSLAAATCAGTISATGAVGRWYRTFCAYGLPSPTLADNAMTIDCGGGQCGTGNCEIAVYWDDSRAGAGDVSFKVCTRLFMQN